MKKKIKQVVCVVKSNFDDVETERGKLVDVIEILKEVKEDDKLIQFAVKKLDSINSNLYGICNRANL